MKDPIFIVGLPRSGSTLWLNILAQHPSVCRFGEMLFLTPWRKDFRAFLGQYSKSLQTRQDLESAVEEMFADRLTPGLSASFWVNDLPKLTDPQLKERILTRLWNSDKSLQAFFKAVVEEITEWSDLERPCVKFPTFVNYVPELIEWYPECKIVHISRDPRAMLISRKSDPGGTQIKIKKHPRLAALTKAAMSSMVLIQYVWSSRIHRKLRTSANYRLFKFEDLLANPEETVRSLAEFAGLSFEPAMLHPSRGQASSITGRKHSGFNPTAAIKWKEVIRPWEYKVITLLTKSSMGRFEYDPITHPLVGQKS